MTEHDLGSHTFFCSLSFFFSLWSSNLICLLVWAADTHAHYIFPPVKHVVILDPIFWCYCCLLWSWVTWLDLSIPSHTHALMDSSFFFLECTSGLFCWKENVDNIWGYWSEKIVIYNRLNLVWYFMFDWMMHCWKFLLKLNISQTSYSFALKLSFILFFFNWFSLVILWSLYRTGWNGLIPKGLLWRLKLWLLLLRNIWHIYS